MNAKSVIKKQTISAQVADQIRLKIIFGHYKAGDQLRQEVLATEFGVSRIPVREALHQLNSEGFVRLISHKGAIVSEVSIDEIRELFELRAHIETWLLGLSIPNMTKGDIAIANATLVRIDNARKADNWNELNWDFHSALLSPAQRPTTVGLLQKIHQQIERYTRMIVSFAPDQKQAHREHSALLKYCEKGDVARAVEQMDSHILNSAKFLVGRLVKLRGLDTSSNVEVLRPRKKAS